MPMFVAVHKWKPEDYQVITKELLGSMSAMSSGTLPKGVKLCSTYSMGGQGAYCVWEADSKAALEKTFDRYAPNLKKYTEFVPVVQAYPPSMEYVLGLAQRLYNVPPK